MLKQRLDQRQVQKLILAPALQQAIKLLPLTNLELIEIINEEISQNPMIEIEGETAAEGAKESAAGSESSELEKTPDAGVSSEETVNMDYETSFQEYLDDGFRPHFTERKEATSLENTLSKSLTLWDHLNWQADLNFTGKEDQDIARFIIGNIDEDGYLGASVEEIASLYRASPERIDALREKIKMFDPVGAGSLSLQEALLAQMDQLQIKDDISRAIVSRHLGLLEKSEYSQLARTLGISLQEVKVHIDLIKTLNPTPGRKYSEEKTSYVVPDIIVTKEGDEWKIRLNDEGLPSLRISGYYRQLLAKVSQSQPEAGQFLKDRLKKALWFLRSLDQRNRTIYRVAKFIVDKQKDYFEKGLNSIRPLTLVEVAQEIGVHESTVGRVVANKYMITPQGAFSLKYFFHKSLHGDFGEDVSSLKIKDRIKRLVDQEDKNIPLSDIEIGDILSRENLKIARRTVAKYRNQLNIPPSHIRKRKFTLEGMT